MAHSYSRLVYHLVFSTKERRPLLKTEVRPRVLAYLGGIVRNLGGEPLANNGVEDHVHMLAKLPGKIAIADAIRDIKANSSKWMHDEGLVSRSFGWQTGYAAFTVSKSGEDAVRRYIADQERHHRKMTFKEELIQLLERHGIEYDERYLWD
jgi:REP element-mobilizing transposase RayT